MQASVEARRYNVHLYAVVRVEATGVAADSHRQAAQRAYDRLGPELHERLHLPGVEYAEEVSHFLVDAAGDEDFSQSQSFYSQEDPLLANLARLILWHDGERDEAELKRIIADARDVLHHAV